MSALLWDSIERTGGLPEVLDKKLVLFKIARVIGPGTGVVKKSLLECTRTHIYHIFAATLPVLINTNFASTNQKSPSKSVGYKN